MGRDDVAKLPLRKNSSMVCSKNKSLASPRWNRSPPTMAHNTLMMETLKAPLKSTILSELVAALVRRSSSSWWISSWKIFSDEVRPKPKSLRWRSVKRRCSCHWSPSKNMIPIKVTSDFNIKSVKYLIQFIPSLSKQVRALSEALSGRPSRSGLRRVSWAASKPQTEMTAWLGPR